MYGALARDRASISFPPPPPRNMCRLSGGDPRAPMQTRLYGRKSQTRAKSTGAPIHLIYPALAGIPPLPVQWPFIKLRSHPADLPDHIGMASEPSSVPALSDTYRKIARPPQITP